MGSLHKVCLFFTILGALNWGLVGLFEFNLVTGIFGDGAFSTVLYSLIAIAGIVNIGLLFTPIERKKA